MQAFVILLLKLLPFLPSVVRTVEQIHGAGNGPSKLDTAVSLLQAVVPEVVSHLQAEPANKPMLESLISTIVTGINAANSWKAQQDGASMGG